MNPSSKIYEITLRPLGSFFFGGEVVFGELNEEASRRRSYLVHSRVLPQQTTILGMLREQLLRQNKELLPPNASQGQVDDAINRVGEASFGRQYLDGTPATGFGHIKEISPLKIVYGQELLTVAPLDDLPGKDKAACDYNQETTTPYLSNFDAKKGLFYGFQDSGGHHRVSTDELFTPESRVGITVTNRNNWRTNVKDKEAFYRQTSFRHHAAGMLPLKDYEQETLPAEKPTTAFRFWVRLASPLNSTIVTMGGERSAFNMEVKPTNKTNWEEDFSTANYYYPKALPPGYKRLVLLSDAYLPKAEMEKHKVFAVAETIPFRFFSTLLGTTKNFYDVGDRKTKSLRRQSGGFRLLQRGSVLYVPAPNLNDLKTALRSEKAFRTIGYNYFSPS